MEHIGLYLKDIYFNNKKGQFVFKNKISQRYLFFLDGNLIFAKTNNAQEMLGEVLFKLGKISEETYAKIDDFIEPKEKLGEMLVKKGIISQENLLEALMYQMREITLNIFSVFEGNFRFQEKESFTEKEFELKISIPVLIEEGIRRMKFHPFLQKFMANRVLVPKGKEFFFRLTEEEKEVLEALDGKSSAKAILSSSRFNPEFFWKSLFLLYCLDLIDYKRERKSSPGEQEFTQPVSHSMDEQIEDMLAMRDKLPGMDYYKILNAPHTATQEEIKKSYFHLARKYHPDRFGQNLPSEIQEKIDEVFNHISRAYRTLMDEAARKEYDAQIMPPPLEEKRDLGKKIEIKFRQAKTLYEMGKYEDALVLLEETVRTQGARGSYYLLLAMTEAKIPVFLKKAEEDFLKAIRLEPWNPEGYVGLGLLYKQEGLSIKAKKQFERALRIDPEHQVARRELSLFNKDRKKNGLKGVLSFDFFSKNRKK